MASRPQFSLRMLFFVTAMVCLAAAAMRLSPGSADLTERAAVRLQDYLRLAECLLFPAIFMAWAVAKSGRSRAFCLGAILPAAMPLLLVGFYAGALRQNLLTARPSSVLEELNWLSFSWAERITALWVCAVLIGASSVFFRWFLPTGAVDSAEARQSLIVRLSIVVVFLAFASAAIIVLPDSSEAGPDVNRLLQAPIRLILCLILPAMLVVGAVESRGNRRAFCGCALFPAVAPLLLAHVAEAIGGQVSGRWEPSLLYRGRYMIVAMWALAPLFGGVCLFFHWLFQRGENANGE